MISPVPSLPRTSRIGTGSFSVGRRLALSAALFITGIGVVIFYTIAMTRELTTQSQVMNIAGRQRMLNERYVTAVLLASRGVDAPQSAIWTLLRDSVEVLAHGGRAVVSATTGETAWLPPAPSEEIRTQLLRQGPIIEELKLRAAALLESDSASAEAHVKALVATNQALHQEANRAVTLFAAHSQAEINSMVTREIALGVMMALLGALLTYQVVRTNRELENQMSERLRVESDLYESERARADALKQSDAFKSAVLASVSHELRTPLTAMKTTVSSLHDEWERMAPGDRVEFLGALNDEVDYLSRLVDNLLDMSRIEAGAFTPKRQWHLLDDLVEVALRRTAPRLGTRRLDVSLPGDLPLVFVDAVQIQQVLVNLIDNAEKYSDADSPIRLEVSRQESAIEIRVTNRGEGIPAADLERIFDRFYRVQVRRNHTVPGTGLGLPICKAFIEAHGGHLTAQSQPGIETTFSCVLPLIQGAIQREVA